MTWSRCRLLPIAANTRLLARARFCIAFDLRLPPVLPGGGVPGRGFGITWRIGFALRVLAPIRRPVGRLWGFSRRLLGALAEEELSQLRQADARLQQGVLKPQQRLQQGHDPLLRGGIEPPVLRLLDQPLDLRGLDLNGLRIGHCHSRTRKSFASGYTHTVLIGTWPRR